MSWLRTCAATLLLSTLVHAGEPGLLLYAPFETDAVPTIANGSAEMPYNRHVESVDGKVGKAAGVVAGKTQLIYDGPGNASTTAGTLSFFWRPDDDPAKASTVVVDISPFERINYNRFIRLSYGGGKLSVYFTAGIRGAIGFATIPLNIAQGQWTHVALCWDQTRGIALYVNGEKKAERLLPWVYEGLTNQIGLGLTTRGDFRPGTANFSQSFDELRVYDRWLDDAALRALAANETPTVQPIDMAALLTHREALYHWDDDAAANMPTAALGGDLGLRQVGIGTAVDVGRTSLRAFDGEYARRWPGGTGYADAGQELRITLDGRQQFDVMQLLGLGRLALTTGQSDEPFVQLSLDDFAAHRRVFDPPIEAEKLSLLRVPDDEGRRTGGVYEMTLFERVPAQLLSREGWQKLHLAPAEATPIIRQSFYSTDQTTLDAKAAAGSGSFTFPAYRTVHIVGPEYPQRRGLGAIAIDLKVTRGAPTVVRCAVADPLTGERFLTTADVRVTGNAGALRLLIDHRDMVLPENVRPRVSLTFRDDVEVDLGDSRIGYQWMPIDQALPQHLHDQMARGKDVFQEISEARSWPYWRSLRAVGLLHYIMQELYTLAPDNETVISYWHWINPGLQKALVDLPPVPDGTPLWAVYLDASIDALKKVPYWWIDHRENQYGEFGANDGINDDTDLVMDWWAMHLMRGPDEKLVESLRRVADRSWDITMRRTGLGHVTDALHHYEDGINTQCHMALADYGNPVYIERMMATTRYYKDLMAVNSAGHLHFYDDHYGWSQLKDEPGKYVAVYSRVDRDEGQNALTLQPAILLGWYNANDYCIDVAKRWTDGMLAHYVIDDNGEKRAMGTDVYFETDKPAGYGYSFGYGFIDLPYAMWNLTGGKSYLDFIRMAADTEIRRYRYPRVGSAFDRYVHATGDHAFKDRAVAQAGASQLWVGSIHNDNYYVLDNFYLAWQMTGDIGFINDGVKLTLNDTIWELPMLTEGEQSTDRVWTPQRLVNRVALGGAAMLRNELYPKLGASWEGATGRIAPFVFSQDRSQLSAWIVNLDDKPAAVTMRLWNLDHGAYTIAQGLDADSDRAFDAPPTTRNATLAPYSPVDLNLPPRAVTLLTITQTKRLDDVRLRPDLAVCADDATYDPASRQLTVVIHNIGAKPSSPAQVRATVGGKAVFETQLPALEAPADMQPRVRTLSFPVDAGPVTVEVTGADAEITDVNNRVVIRPGELPAN